MKIRTKRSKFAKACIINAGVLEKLYTENATIDEVRSALQARRVRTLDERSKGSDPDSDHKEIRN